MDLLGALIGGAIIIPFIMAIAFIVKLDSRGPVFYGHRRIGKNGKPFVAWKFRSMIGHAEERLRTCLEDDPSLQEEWESSHKLRVDPRVTRVGRVLRRTSLDELPQLWNVFMGEMSLVGPRPIVKDEIPSYGKNWGVVKSVRPGLIGLWQISGRSERGYQERVELDLYYIENWSLWLDVFVLLKTMWIVCSGKGAC
jgi:Undecaprenyl-phosphate galactose phosphotransferase WbaP